MINLGYKHIMLTICIDLADFFESVFDDQNLSLYVMMPKKVIFNAKSVLL